MLDDPFECETKVAQEVRGSVKDVNHKTVRQQALILSGSSVFSTFLSICFRSLSGFISPSQQTLL